MNADQIKRHRIKENLRSELESTIERRTDRYLEIDRQAVIANHHFAEASSECIKLYRDGYFISTVMVSQAVNEAIIKFVVEKNCISRHQQNTQGKTTKGISDLIDELETKNVVSAECTQASRRICRSFRSDVHHLNPKVRSIPFEKLAKRNLQDLTIIEKEIFGVSHKGGKLIPDHPRYWDVQSDGTVPVFLRLE